MVLHVQVHVHVYVPVHCTYTYKFHIHTYEYVKFRNRVHQTYKLTVKLDAVAFDVSRGNVYMTDASQCVYI